MDAQLDLKTNQSLDADSLEEAWNNAKKAEKNS
jgi:hypothetical protein